MVACPRRPDGDPTGSSRRSLWCEGQSRRRPRRRRNFCYSSCCSPQDERPPHGPRRRCRWYGNHSALVLLLLVVVILLVQCLGVAQGWSMSLPFDNYYGGRIRRSSRNRSRRWSGSTRNGAKSTSQQSSSSQSPPDYTFFDEAIISVRAGSGGPGASTYQTTTTRRGSSSKPQPQGPPDGGRGGRGGHVVLVVDPSLNTLAGLASSSLWPKSFRAEHGAAGANRLRNGRCGKNVEIRVPPGTRVQEQHKRRVVVVNDDDADNNNSNSNHNDATAENGQEIVEWIDVGTLGLPSSSSAALEVDNFPENNYPSGTTTTTTTTTTSLIVAFGGEGGDGSAVMEGSGGEGGGASGRRGGRRCPPTGGERKTLKLTLQLVADVALVAVPNAGKSTFLAAVTRAKPKIANYPFTTIVPNLGVWVPPAPEEEEDDDDALHGGDGLVLCDVPGLIAGAAQGVGLGHEFLRHVERCHVILHLVDATSPDPVADYEMINREILQYSQQASNNSKLATLPQIVVVNKVDAFEDYQREDGDPKLVSMSSSTAAAAAATANDWEEGLRQVRMPQHELEAKLRAVMPHSRLLWMSARERDGVDQVMTRLAAFVRKVKAAAEANQPTSPMNADVGM